MDTFIVYSHTFEVRMATSYGNLRKPIEKLRNLKFYSTLNITQESINQVTYPRQNHASFKLDIVYITYEILNQIRQCRRSRQCGQNFASSKFALTTSSENYWRTTRQILTIILGLKFQIIPAYIIFKFESTVNVTRILFRLSPMRRGKKSRC